LARVLGEMLDIGAVKTADEKLVVAFESEGGSLPALLSFLECVLEDGPTRALIEGAAMPSTSPVDHYLAPAMVSLR